MFEPAINSDDAFTKALSSNSTWAAATAQSNPDLFPKLAVTQTPKILWLGCSDSRVPETTLLGLGPGEVFTHRNIANIISATDINTAAVVEYAVVHLKVEHVILCGHIGCGGVAGALSGGKIGGVLDTWLMPLKALAARSAAALEGLSDKEKAVKLVELNVAEGVATLKSNFAVIEAIRDRELKVHGLVYDVGSGHLRELSL